MTRLQTGSQYKEESNAWKQNSTRCQALSAQMHQEKEQEVDITTEILYLV